MAASPLGALLNPALLGLGAALVAVPILIHLLSRRRVQRVPWAAMQWLLAAIKRHQRRLRIENWLILLLRALAVFLLGLALARPIVESPELAGLLSGKKSVYVVVDTSYSMAARREGRSVVDVATAETDAVLAELGPDDTVSVVVTNDIRVEQSDGRPPYVLVPRTVGREGATRAREAVAGLNVRDAPADWAETLSRVMDQTAEEDVNRLVVLVTDLQRRDWREERVLQGLEDLLLSPAAIRIVDVGPTERRNLTVRAVTNATGRDMFVGRPARLLVTVENQGATPIQGAHVKVFRDQEATPLVARRLDDLPAADALTGEARAPGMLLSLPGRAFEKPGSQVLRVEVSPPHDDAEADILGRDSQRHLAVTVRDRIRVVAWTKRSRDAKIGAETYLRGVFEPWETSDRPERGAPEGSLYDLRTVDTETALADALARTGREAPDLVVLANVAPRGRGIPALAAFVRAGGALLGFVGDDIGDPAVLNEAFYDDPDTRLLPLAFDRAETLRPERTTEAFAFDLEEEGAHPLAGPFTGEDARTWIGEAPPLLWGRMPFREPEAPTPVPGEASPDGGTDAATAADEVVVLRFRRDGKPAVVEGGLGLGRTLWVGTSVDQGWFERALPFFLPVFLDEAAVYLTRPDEARRNLTVGRRIVVTWLPPDATDPRFIAPGGTESPPKLYGGLGEADRPVLFQDRVGTAGAWRLAYARAGTRGEVERVTEMFAVNPDPGEGRLARISDAALRGSLPPDADLQIVSTWTDVGGDAQKPRQGEFSLLLVWIAIGILLLESVLAWLFGRRKQPEPAATTRGGEVSR